MDASRVRELEELHRKLAGTKHTVSRQALVKYSGRNLPGFSSLSREVTFSEFLESYQAELNRRLNLEDNLKAELVAYRMKLKQHTELIDVDAQSLNREGLSEESSISLCVVQANQLPSMNTNNTADSFFVVFLDDESIYQSNLMPDTSSPVWNEKVKVPISTRKAKVRIEIWDDDRNPELIGTVNVELNSIADQKVHNRLYDIEGPEGIMNGQLLVELQWLYDLKTYHKNFIKHYEELIRTTQDTLDDSVSHLDLFINSQEKALLAEWFGTAQETKTLKEVRKAGYSSLSHSRAPSQVSSPVTPKRSGSRNRAAKKNQLSLSLLSDSDFVSFETPSKSYQRKIKYEIDYVAIGLYYMLKESVLQ
mmetsp:Transcript_23393/g.41506  ORF Transcript_23393/g.41506 Transcript_23393/m.41506 type:complete len:364 (-) Transcript_23393:55-1146(-)